jgi:hypothetical protein
LAYSLARRENFSPTRLESPDWWVLAELSSIKQHQIGLVIFDLLNKNSCQEGWCIYPYFRLNNDDDFTWQEGKGHNSKRNLKILRKYCLIPMYCRHLNMDILLRFIFWGKRPLVLFYGIRIIENKKDLRRAKKPRFNLQESTSNIQDASTVRDLYLHILVDH